jgi:hypothetical protein
MTIILPRFPQLSDPEGLSSRAVADHARPPEPSRSEIDSRTPPVEQLNTRMPTNWHAAHAGQ